jgi:hypothetical protein
MQRRQSARRCISAAGSGRQTEKLQINPFFEKFCIFSLTFQPRGGIVTVNK